MLKKILSVAVIGLLCGTGGLRARGLAEQEMGSETKKFSLKEEYVKVTRAVDESAKVNTAALCRFLPSQCLEAPLKRAFRGGWSHKEFYAEAVRRMKSYRIRMIACAVAAGAGGVLTLIFEGDCGNSSEAQVFPLIAAGGSVTCAAFAVLFAGYKKAMPFFLRLIKSSSFRKSYETYMSEIDAVAPLGSPVRSSMATEWANALAMELRIGAEPLA